MRNGNKPFVLFESEGKRIIVRNHGDDSYDIDVECRFKDLLGVVSWCKTLDADSENQAYYLFINRIAHLIETKQISKKLLKNT
jgi:hypothetical protein